MTGPARPPLLTIGELSRACDLSESCIRGYIKSGLITVLRPGGTVRIPAAGVGFLPPAGDRLISPEHVYKITRLTRHQLSYARRKGWVTAVRTPGGYFRYLESEIRARYGRVAS